ncbi:MAG TPA: RNA polymerase sigma factor [Polyangiaceae bacterium]
MPSNEAALDALMDRLARGDRSAFDPLYVALQPRALRLAQLRLGAALAKDVAQSALLRVFSRASEFEPGRPCLPWFYAIVANEIRSAKRGAARYVLDPSASEGLIDEAQNAEAKLVTRELERALQLAVDALDAESAKALRAMLGLEPMPDLHPATFRKRVSRAYAKLRLIFGGHDVG